MDGDGCLSEAWWLIFADIRVYVYVHNTLLTLSFMVQEIGMCESVANAVWALLNQRFWS